MQITPRRDTLNKVVILNPKGGCGKSTLATNLAAAYARKGSQPAIMDFDPQGSSIGWLQRRPAEAPAIHGNQSAKGTGNPYSMLNTRKTRPLAVSGQPGHRGAGFNLKLFLFDSDVGKSMTYFYYNTTKASVIKKQI